MDLESLNVKEKLTQSVVFQHIIIQNIIELHNCRTIASRTSTCHRRGAVCYSAILFRRHCVF